MASTTLSYVRCHACDKSKVDTTCALDSLGTSAITSSGVDSFTAMTSKAVVTDVTNVKIASLVALGASHVRLGVAVWSSATDVTFHRAQIARFSPYCAGGHVCMSNTTCFIVILGTSAWKLFMAERHPLASAFHWSRSISYLNTISASSATLS